MLDNFFRINLPYGIMKNGKDEWTCFNREYAPLGYNSKDGVPSIYSENLSPPFIFTKYQFIGESFLLQLAGSEEHLKRDANGKIEIVFLYSDRTNPTNRHKKEYWEIYFEKLRLLASKKIYSNEV